MKDIILFIILSLVVLGSIVYIPLAFIWSFNTLFPVLAIPYDFWTWLAMLVFLNLFIVKVKVG